MPLARAARMNSVPCNDLGRQFDAVGLQGLIPD
jgi:hypothetical protein